MLAVS